MSSVLSCSDIDAKQEGEEDRLAEERRKAVIGAATLVLAMVIHTVLEGFAFGIQRKIVNVGSLFIGIVIHKALVSFSVGMSLIQALSHNRKVAIAAVIMLATFTPIGGLIGIGVEASEMHTTTKGVTTAVLTSISLGTFLYIALFEILAHERSKKQPRLLQWAGFAGGFTVMALVMAFNGHQHSHGQEDGGLEML